MRTDEATLVYVKDQCVWVPELDCSKVTWSKQPPPRPDNGWPGVRYSVGYYGYFNVNGSIFGPSGPAGGIVLAPWSIVGIGATEIYIRGSDGATAGYMAGAWPWARADIIRNDPIDPEPPPTGCVVTVFRDGENYWSRRFDDIPCSEIPVEKECPNDCPPGTHKVILDRNTGNFCCCECPPV